MADERGEGNRNDYSGTSRGPSPETGNQASFPTPETTGKGEGIGPSLIPDRFTPIVGYRLWNANEEGLWSLTCGIPWPHREKLVSKCNAVNTGSWYLHDAPDHYKIYNIAGGAKPSPLEGCNCGIYSMQYKSLVPDNPPNQYGQDRAFPVVTGEVYLWGKVIRCEVGYRAEFAYPKSLQIIRYPEEGEQGFCSICMKYAAKANEAGTFLGVRLHTQYGVPVTFRRASIGRCYQPHDHTDPRGSFQLKQITRLKLWSKVNVSTGRITNG